MPSETPPTEEAATSGMTSTEATSEATLGRIVSVESMDGGENADEDPDTPIGAEVLSRKRGRKSKEGLDNVEYLVRTVLEAVGDKATKLEEAGEYFEKLQKAAEKKKTRDKPGLRIGGRVFVPEDIQEAEARVRKKLQEAAT